MNDSLRDDELYACFSFSVNVDILACIHLYKAISHILKLMFKVELALYKLLQE